MSDSEIQKYIKQVRDEANEDMKSHLGVLNEMHGENLKGIRDGFAIVNKKLDEHTKILGSHTEMIGELKTDMTGVKERLDGVETRLEQIEDKLGIKEHVFA